ncbi:MAG TPA: hypothetical protein VIJ19_01280, partial [Opitutaceae bacterium]
WNEEICGAATRDLRVERNLHMFQLHLSAIEMDFHPVRSRSRRKLQTLLTSLLGTVPQDSSASAPAAAPSWGVEPVGPLEGPAASLAEAQAEGPVTLGTAAGRLAKLLSDIRDWEPIKYRTST